jgi:hypothetical protein
MEFVASPDAPTGIWEVRGGQRHFVHSKMMAWVAVDRSSGSWNSPRRHPCSGCAATRSASNVSWARLRPASAFVQAYNTRALDAACC